MAQIKTSPKRRKCKYPLCENILSIYNHEKYCNVHLGLMFLKDNIKGELANKVVKRAA